MVMLEMHEFDLETGEDKVWKEDVKFDYRALFNHLPENRREAAFQNWLKDNPGCE